MTGRTLRYAFTRFTVVVPGLVGAGLVAAAELTTTHGSVMGGGITLGLALLNGLRHAGKAGLDARLAFDEERRAHGVDRRLKTTERIELAAIAAYCDRLRADALEPELALELANDTMKQAWELVRTASGQDGTKQLAAFRAGLPGLADAPASTPLNERIQRDLERRQKIEKELEG